MKVFNARAAADEYMSTHSLTFSTPEMTLKKFAMWLGEPIDNSKENEGTMPRLMSFIEEKKIKGRASFLESMPDVSDTFQPSGAVTKMYGQVEDTKLPKHIPSVHEDVSLHSCNGCGSEIKSNAKYCTNCGKKQF
jgi:hypothetical protein